MGVGAERKPLHPAWVGHTGDRSSAGDLSYEGVSAPPPCKEEPDAALRHGKMRAVAIEPRLDSFTRLPVGQDFPGARLAEDEPVVFAAGHEELAVETEPNGVDRLQGDVGDLSR